jgi:hypothetical protein
MIIDQPRTDLGIRYVTDEEVATLERDGWVKLDGLITSDPRGGDTKRGYRGRGRQLWRRRRVGLCRPGAWDHRVEPFYSFTLGPPWGRNAPRLINRQRRISQAVTAR